MGTEIDVPLNYKDAAFVRSHFDAMAVRVPDAPRADEIVVALVVTTAAVRIRASAGSRCRRPRRKMGCGKKDSAGVPAGSLPTH